MSCKRFRRSRHEDPLTLFQVRNFASSTPRWETENNCGHEEHSGPLVLVFTDGAAPDNGHDNVRAGCAVVTGPGSGFGRDEYQYRSFRLETSPSHDLTSNRAELRAAVAALVETDWKAEGFRGIVIATDSEYVAKGATEYMPTWRNELTGEWKVKRANMDLWDRLMAAIEAWQSEEFLVMFYAIRRDWNRADRYAKEAAVSVTSSHIVG